jgi:hypothetical protein
LQIIWQGAVVKQLISTKMDADLLLMKPMTDPNKFACMRIINTISTCCFCATKLDCLNWLQVYAADSTIQDELYESKHLHLLQLDTVEVSSGKPPNVEWYHKQATN